jgi:DNA-binding LytR/AlgR family response regulator
MNPTLMKALIIEDEKLIAQDLEAKIKSVANDIEIIQILPSVKTAKKWFLNNEEPDLMFMDIQLSDGISFEIFDAFKLTCPVVFTTAYNEYAMRAFKVNGVDYILKPVDTTELQRAIDKCRSIVASKSQLPVDMKQMITDYKNPGAAATKFKEKFIVNYRNQWIPVNVSEIALFMRDTLNQIYTLDGNHYNFDFNTLDEVEEVVDPNLFFRANRQFIIHINTIQTVKPVENQKLVVRLKEPNQKFEIDISREKAPSFKKWLNR